MKIIITGATGFVARQTIPYLKQIGADLVLVGRDQKTLQRAYPEMLTCCYETMEKHALNADALLHMAVKNNNNFGELEEFRLANVVFLKEIFERAKRMNIPHFIYISTLHTQLSRMQGSFYARSKLEAEGFLLAQNKGSQKVSILRLATVYGEQFEGKLSILNYIPSSIRSIALDVIKSFRPTLNAKHLAQTIFELNECNNAKTVFVTDTQRDNTTFKIFARFRDLVFCGLVLIFFWWGLVLIWLSIKLTSSGPGIFDQQRIGQYGQHFTCYKFRTMKKGTIQAGTHEVESDSITKIGSFLRKTKLDELPQIFNILKNELSLIGPRPCLPMQNELIRNRKIRGVFDVKPGITGWAQIQNVDMASPIKLSQLDAEYIALQSIAMELSIILATATGSGQRDKI